LVSNGFKVVIDTALDGPDAKHLAALYLDYLKDYEVKCVGIYCPLEERLKRLKTRTDNLFLTEDFIKMQEGLFEDCKEFYDIWFDSSKIAGEEIAGEVTIQVLAKMKE
jgi:chloramphenicol 3-O-phosphotransferase